MSELAQESEKGTVPVVSIRVFGGMGVSVAGELVNIGGPMQRKLLALFVLRRDTYVSQNWLAEQLWTDRDRPNEPEPTIRTYVSRLRAAFPEHVRHWFETETSGYRFVAPTEVVETLHLSDLRRQARVARDRDDPQRAMRLLDDAHSLWRGEPFIEVEDLDWALANIEQLRLERLDIQEERWEAALELGRHTQITGELAVFTADHGLRDRATRQYALALYRSGRTSEALRVLDGHRARLAHESGLEPSRSFTELEAAILRSDESLDVATEGRPLRGYRLLEEVGVGAFSTVWRAIQPSVDRPVAIKQIRAELASDPRFIRRFEAEAQIVARIEHPHIVPLIDFWRDPDSAYLVMRWLDGGTLESRIRNGTLEVDAALTIAEQVGNGLSAAHESGVIHRDVKPANILFDARGNAFLADFGIAFEAGAQNAGLATISPGSPLYASPEQRRGEVLDASSDVFSLAAVLYEGLTGMVPNTSMIDGHDGAAGVGSSRSLTELRPDVSQNLGSAITRALSSEPSERFASAEDFLAAIRRSDSAGGMSRRAFARSSLHLVNPYKGLQAFDSGDAGFFFGRERLVDDLILRLGGTGLRSRCTLVIGPSGSGKSSVVRAGLLPRVRAGDVPGSTDWFVTSMVPGADPYEALEASLLRVAINPPASLLDQLRDGDRGILRGIHRCLGSDDQSMLLFVDQFEEVFTGTVNATANDFLAALAVAVREPTSPLRLVATMRADFYDRPLQHATFASLLDDAVVAVTPLDPGELERAIVEPALRVGAEFEPGLAVRIAAEASGQPSPLPLLQYSLHELFARRGTNVLTAVTYDEIGGLAGALSAGAEEMYLGASDEKRAAIRRVFGRLTNPQPDATDVRRRVAISDFGDDGLAKSTIDDFAAGRFLTFDRDTRTREPTVEIAHEALFRSWPRLVGWLDEDAELLRSIIGLDTASDTWLEGGRADTDLYRGARLEHANELEASSPERLRSLNREFLESSRHHERRVQQRRRGTQLVVGAALLAAALLATVFAIVARDDRVVAEEQRSIAEQNARESETQRTLAEQRALESEALARAATDPELALLLAVEAQAAGESDEAIRPLLTTLGDLPAESVTFDDFRRDGQEISGGAVMLSDEFGSASARFRCSYDVAPGVFLYSSSDSSPVVALVDAANGSGRTVDVERVGCTTMLNPTQTKAVSTEFTTASRTVVVDLENGTIEAESGEINQTHWMPDGRIIGFAPTAPEGRFDVGDQSEPAELLITDSSLSEFERTGVSGSAVYPDRSGTHIVLSQRDGETRQRVRRSILDASDLTVVHDLGVVERTPTQIVWSPDDSLFGDVSASDHLRIWRVQTGEMILDMPLGFDTSAGTWLAFSPTNSEVAVVRRTGEVIVLPTDGRSQRVIEARGAASLDTGVTGAASFVDSDTLAILLNDGSVELTDLRSSAIGTSRTPAPPNVELLAGGLADEMFGVARITSSSELVVLGDSAIDPLSLPFEAAKSLTTGMVKPAESSHVVVWSSDGGTFTSVVVDLADRTVMTAARTFDLPVGTVLATATHDRVLAQTSAGTVFQFSFAGERLDSRVDIDFVAVDIAQSNTSARAILAGREQIALVDLDSGRVLERADVAASAPTALISDELVVVTRLGGDIELWSTSPLQRIGPLLTATKRSPDESLSVTEDGELWYHGPDESFALITDREELRDLACRIAERSLTEAEWEASVSATRPYDPSC